MLTLLAYRTPGEQCGQQPGQEVGVRVPRVAVPLALYVARLLTVQACA